MNIAIVSPAQNAYSETFIQAHKTLLNGSIHYLYGSEIPFKSEFTNRRITPVSFIERMWFAIKYNFQNSEISKPQYALKRYLKKHNIQCVLAEYGTTGAKIYKVCEQLKIPLIVHFHGYDASMYDVIKANKSEYQRMFPVARFVIGVSMAMMDRLKELGVDENKLIYNTYGPDDSFFEIEQKPDPSPVFFGVGRFADKKAPYYTLMAFRKVLEKFPNSKLILAGEGPLLEASINLARYFGIEQHAVFPGALKHHEVKERMSKATAFVQHSITARNGDMEGTPVGILEASAAGLPVVSTQHAGIPDVIVHQKTGLLCEEHDYDKMAEYMLWIAENPEEAKKMGAAGRENIKKNFSMKRHIDQLNQIIGRAVHE